MEPHGVFVAIWGTLDTLREIENLTHAGSHQGKEGPVVWGLRYPNPELIVYRPVPGEPVMRELWEQITDRPPPFPWNEAGDGVVYP